MIKSIILLATWFLLMYLGWKFVKLNIDQVEKFENEYFGSAKEE